MRFFVAAGRRLTLTGAVTKTRSSTANYESSIILPFLASTKRRRCFTSDNRKNVEKQQEHQSSTLLSTSSAISASAASAASDNTTSSSFPLDASSWRQQQLHRLEQKFASNANNDEHSKDDKDSTILIIDNDNDLQQHWRQMESRVRNRKSRRDGPTGRRNVKKTDEDIWLQQGLYDDDDDDDDAAAAAAGDDSNRK